MNKTLEDQKDKMSELHDRYKGMISISNKINVPDLWKVKTLVEDLLAVADAPMIENKYWGLSTYKYAGFYYMACKLIWVHNIALEGFFQSYEYDRKKGKYITRLQRI